MHCWSSRVVLLLAPCFQMSLLSWRDVCTDQVVSCQPREGWKAAQFSYHNLDAMHGLIVDDAYITLAWNPDSSLRQVEVSAQYGSRVPGGEWFVTSWHGEWFARRAPSSGLRTNFDYQGVARRWPKKWTSIWFNTRAMDHGSGKDFAKRRVELRLQALLLYSSDGWVEVGSDLPEEPPSHRRRLSAGPMMVE